MTMRPWKNWLLGPVFVALSAMNLWGQTGKTVSKRLPVVYSDSGTKWYVSNASIVSHLRKRGSCAGKIEVNTVRENADYIFRIASGAQARWSWVVVNRNGSVVDSGSVFIAWHGIDNGCRAIVKDWQERKPDSEKQLTAPDR